MSPVPSVHLLTEEISQKNNTKNYAVYMVQLAKYCRFSFLNVNELEMRFVFACNFLQLHLVIF